MEIVFWAILACLSTGGAWWITTPMRASGHARLTTLVLVLLPLSSLALYLYMGSPDQKDLPLETRLDLPINELPVGAALAKVEMRLRETPNDVTGWKLIATLRQSLAMHDKAIDSWRRVLQLEGPSAEVYIAIAENFLMIEGGVLSVVAMENIRAALRIEPENPVAIYYMGLAEAQSGETDRAIEIWRDLLNNSSIDPNLRALIEDQIEKR